MNTFGSHLLIDLWLKKLDEDPDVNKLCTYVRRHFTVVNEVEHRFYPHGLTKVLVLSESHFSIHTYPEHHYMSMDLYICDLSVNLKKVEADLISMFNCINHQSVILPRGKPQFEERPQWTSTLNLR